MIAKYLQQVNDTEVKTMHYGTVRWFNKKTGAGFIRTDDGEGVIFLNSDIQDSDPSSIDKGSRVTLYVQKSRSGVLAAINVRSTELSQWHD